MTMWAPELQNATKSKYEAIADRIAEDIASGKLQPGQRLPTQRELSRRLSVTIGTIGRAYALAEKRGLVSLEVGRGSFVRSFESKSSQLEARPNVIDLGLNLPPVTEHHRSLARTLSDISNARDVGALFGNAPVESFERHRSLAAQWLGRRIACTSENVLICSGTQNALLTTLATLARPGDAVMVGALTFPGMLAAANFLQIRLIPLSMDAEGILPSELERGSRESKIVYCIPTNQNPTTITMTHRRRRDIAKQVQKLDLNLIEDDVYGALVEDAPIPITESIKDRSILISSISKTLAVGLRLAFVRVPDQWRERMIDSMRASNFFPAPLLCEIASRWIEDGTADALLSERRTIARRRIEIAMEILDRKLIQGTPQGNHLWIKLPAGWSGETLERAAFENGVNIYASSAFVVPGQQPPSAIRIALGAPRNESELRIGLTKIARLLNTRIDPSIARY